MKQVIDETAICDAMPPLAREMVSLMGFESTMSLCRKLGGLKVSVPRSLSADSRLVQLLGLDMANRLMTKYGGEQIEVPLLASVGRLLRDNAIRADFDGGSTVDELAQRYQLTSRSIYIVLKASPNVQPRGPSPPKRDPRTFDRLDKSDITGEPA
jgi:hypothetical protein